MPDSLEIVPSPAPPATAVAIVVYDRLCTFEFGCAVEIFALPRPEMGAGWYRCRLAAAEPGPLTATGGLRVEVDGGLEVLDTAGTIVIPGWRGAEEPVPEALCHALRQAHGRGARLVSLCSGAFVLAATGLLDGKRATTHWRYLEALQARYPRIETVADVLYVDAGDVLTAAGSAAGLDLGLHLVRRDFGAEVAVRVASRLVVPLHREGTQRQRVERPVAPARSAAARLAGLLDEVLATLDQPWPLDRLARTAGSSKRALHRQFVAATGQSPGDWLIDRQLARVCELLAEPGHTLADIAQATGFDSASTLRHHFRRRLATTPSGYRAARHERQSRPRAGDHC
ncbi:MAG: transcriptional regulator FtrA [Geminicoccaceae bacterium]|nr:MAG: transcriptional regulator FtrA [Geminicoccaceae bacterium]